MRGVSESKSGGFTLLEVILSLVLLGFLALGVSQNLILTRGMAETSVREVTANAVGSGYIEQMKSMEYEVLLASVRDPQTPVPTVLSQGTADALYLNQWNEKDVVIDMDKDSGVPRTMRMRVHLKIDDLAASGNGSLLSIHLQYTWENATTGVEQRRHLRTLRSYVPTF